MTRLIALLLAVFGAALITAGVTVIYWPAGLIIAGVLLLVGLFGPDVE